MIFLQTAATIALLVISSIGPGLFFIRYLRWRPLETLSASVGLSFLLLYLCALLIYALNLSPTWAYAPTALAVAATIICKSDLRRLWRHRETRAAMLAFLALFGWLLLFLFLLRNYSGAGWFGDWYEHYERAVFFADHQPLDTKFLGIYVLPARPPMMNLLAAQFFWQVEPQFELLQVVFAYLNALVVLPCALIAPSFVAKTRNRAWLIAGFLALSPMFVQNGTYTWTKAFAAFYDLTALGLYLAAWRRRDFGCMVAAFACLSVAMLVHYSAAPLAFFLGAHYLLFLFRRRNRKWQELLVSAVIGSAIFLTWLGWSLYAYGTKDTFGSNTAVTASGQFTFTGNLQKIVENTFNTLVPFPLRGPLEAGPAYNPRLPPKGLPYLRDWCFRIYQTSFPAMIGLGGLILIVCLLTMLLIRRPDDGRQHRYAFWFWFVVIVTFVGIAVNGEYDYFGNAHICLQPMVMLGLTFAAVGLPHVPKPVRAAALVGLLVDAALGIVIHFHVLQYAFDISVAGQQLNVGGHLELGMSAVNNAVLKFRNQLTFLGDRAEDMAGLVEVIIVVGTVGIIVGLWFLAARSTTVSAISLPARKSRASAKKRRR